MSHEDVYKLCKDIGCCDVCCLRYLGIRHPNTYENAKDFGKRFEEKPANIERNDENKPSETPQPSSTLDILHTSDIEMSTEDMATETSANVEESTDTESDATTIETNDQVKSDKRNGDDVSSNGTRSPPLKKQRLNVCVSCLGLLQEESWPEYNAAVKEVLEKKQYSCKTFGCGVSPPIAITLREKVIQLQIKQMFPDYDPRMMVPLKDPWRWLYGAKLASHLGMTLDSGAVSPLLIVLNLDYQDDSQELEVLKSISPALFTGRRVEFTRRPVEQALQGVSLAALAARGWGRARAAARAARCVSVVATHAPVYLGGRYIKLSRELPQTPWLVNGKRMMESSVQEIIFEPIIKMYGMSPADAEHRLKFMSAGREDVDVRCLGDGRPFAIGITDPRRELNPDELKQICEEISSGGQVEVRTMTYVTKEDLAVLKSGEETKTKTYEVLCVKLGHSEGSDAENGPIAVTDADIANINSFRNTAAGGARVALAQRTPVRVLHRRPLLTRTKYIHHLEAHKVEGHPQLLVVRVRTSAGAYVKEFVHGELRRTAPCLSHAARAPLDVVALDVAGVQLSWPRGAAGDGQCE